MINEIRLKNFKNFREATMSLGPFSVLVGTNASGKSNVRDALRVLHAIGRGYPLADVFGERWSESGERVWSGIRGGVREVARFGTSGFSLQVNLKVSTRERLVPPDEDPIVEHRDHLLTYRIDIETSRHGEDRKDNGSVRLLHESLRQTEGDDVIYTTHSDDRELEHTEDEIQMWIPELKYTSRDRPLTRSRTRSLLSQIRGETPQKRLVVGVRSAFRSMRFFEFEVAAMRRPSVPGQTVLGDRGENLSSVLETIHKDDETKEQLASWIRELTPMDVVDFRFPRDLQGRTQVVLVEEDGREVSAESASAGTLRLLGVLASVLGPEHARTSFFEELETGIHPARMYLLIDLIEQNVSDDPTATTQVIATTHSPQVLRFLSEETLASTCVVYREEDTSDADIVPVLDIPHVRDVLERKDLGRLFESGWMENSLSFAQTSDT